jgi:hypothetical protein
MCACLTMQIFPQPFAIHHVIAQVVADARHPLFHLPPALYSYITEDLKKPIVMILNKVCSFNRLKTVWSGNHII